MKTNSGSSPGTSGPSCPLRRAWWPLPLQAGLDSVLSMTHSPQLSSLQRHGLKEPAWADPFLQEPAVQEGWARKGTASVRACTHACCVSNLFVDGLILYPECLTRDWVQAYRVPPVPQAHSVSTIFGLWPPAKPPENPPLFRLE